ncbi:hypothetical protein GCM10010232_40320 [Streptomyces amakusaensis]|uniref:LigA protein n=1 Tax=Streptomyces amakusaensis TaxID=67271 RepID=A0ABW0AKG8_9ACTN
MSATDTETPGVRPPPGPAGPGAGPSEGSKPASDEGREAGAAGEQEGGEEADRPDQPQDAWSALRDLKGHSPRNMRVGGSARFGGSLVGGDQHGVSGGQVTGDVFMGGKTEIHYRIGGLASAQTSGIVPRSTLDRLDGFFTADDEHFAQLLARLREERVLVLTGPDFSGRRTAALMLLHRLGVASVRALARDTAPADLAGLGGWGTGEEADGEQEQQAGGHLLCDLVTRRDRPLRETHLLAARDRLAEKNAHLVITVGPTAALDGVTAVEWRPPPAAQLLAAHLRALTDDDTTGRMLALPATGAFLDRSHQPREVAAFAEVLARHARGEAGAEEVAGFSGTVLKAQIQEWFEEDETAIPLRDKAFLVALAAFDGGPYALTAELSDLLYTSLLKTANSSAPPVVPVFGTHIGKRLQLARAKRYEEDEHTEWGPVSQSKAAFHDERAALILLSELWTGHPSARPALINWLRQLADDGRPLVRTRAASTVAILARTDLPSAMALIIEPWALSDLYREKLVAANALAFAHTLGTPNVPRILDQWCHARDLGLCWVAVRTYALIGPERPAQTLAALRGAARSFYANVAEGRDPDPLMASELGESIALLLLSEADEEVLSELRRTIDDDPAVHGLALGGFLSGCRHTEDAERYGMPMLLARYARAAAEGSPVAADIAALWRASLSDRHYTRTALERMRDWVLTAQRSEAAEWALAALLPALVTETAEAQRLAHLLRTMPSEDGTDPPPVAARLLTVLPRLR